jgi:catechol 2,3-dioxygenase-like lactoylglutathione lyase family enzyme
VIGFAPSCKSAFFAKCLLIGCFYAQHAAAQLSPCTTVAPTTPNVIVFVSDIDRSVRWYRDHVGLAAGSGPDLDGRYDRQGTVMRQNGAGLTLVVSTQRSALEIQMVCLVLDGPPAPPVGAPPLFLVDPDGTSIEFPASSGPAQQRQGLEVRTSVD